MPDIPELDRERIIDIVTEALKEVADFQDDADIEGFSFQHFHDFHKKVFATTLKKEVLNVKNDEFHYDIVLNENIIENWDTLGDCVDYIREENILYHSDTTNIQL